MNNKLCIKEIATFNISIDKIEKNLMLWTLESVSSNGVDVKDDNKAVYTKVTADYIKDGMMKWSALRERADGSRFTTIFTWKKVK